MNWIHYTNLVSFSLSHSVWLRWFNLQFIYVFLNNCIDCRYDAATIAFITCYCLLFISSFRNSSKERQRLRWHYGSVIFNIFAWVSTSTQTVNRNKATQSHWLVHSISSGTQLFIDEPESALVFIYSCEETKVRSVSVWHVIFSKVHDTALAHCEVSASLRAHVLFRAI